MYRVETTTIHDGTLVTTLHETLTLAQAIEFVHSTGNTAVVTALHSPHGADHYVHIDLDTHAVHVVRTLPRDRTIVSVPYARGLVQQALLAHRITTPPCDEDALLLMRTTEGCTVYHSVEQCLSAIVAKYQ